MRDDNGCWRAARASAILVSQRSAAININFILHVVVAYVTDRRARSFCNRLPLALYNSANLQPSPSFAKRGTSRGNQVTLMNETLKGISANLVSLFVIYRIITLRIHRCNSAKNAVDDVIPKYIPTNRIAEQRCLLPPPKWRGSNFRDAGKRQKNITIIVNLKSS